MIDGRRPRTAVPSTVAVFPDRPLETFRSLVSHSSEAMRASLRPRRIVPENDAWLRMDLALAAAP
jgi:hypothetical protein